MAPVLQVRAHPTALGEPRRGLYWRRQRRLTQITFPASLSTKRSVDTVTAPLAITGNAACSPVPFHRRPRTMATPPRDEATVESTAHVETTAQSDRIAAERADIDRTIKGATFCSALADTAELHGDVPALSARTETGWATLNWAAVRTRVRDRAL